MANTYTLIASNTLSSSAASVTFSSIPSTYNDLVLRCSARSDQSTPDNLILRFNSDSTTKYSYTVIYAGSATPSSFNAANDASINGFNGSVGSTATANTFSSCEIYIPNYTSTSTKPASHFYATENNSATNFAWSLAGAASQYRGTSAISSITISPPNLFESGSSFFLYGIKNS